MHTFTEMACAFRNDPVKGRCMKTGYSEAGRGGIRRTTKSPSNAGELCQNLAAIGADKLLVTSLSFAELRIRQAAHQQSENRHPCGIQATARQANEMSLLSGFQWSAKRSRKSSPPPATLDATEVSQKAQE